MLSIQVSLIAPQIVFHSIFSNSGSWMALVLLSFYPPLFQNSSLVFVSWHWHFGGIFKGNRYIVWWNVPLFGFVKFVKLMIQVLHFGRICKVEVICASQDIPHREAPGMSLSHLGNVKFDLFKVGAQEVSPPTKVPVPPPRLWKWITFCGKIQCVPISCYLSNSYPVRF